MNIFLSVSSDIPEKVKEKYRGIISFLEINGNLVTETFLRESSKKEEPGNIHEIVYKEVLEKIDKFDILIADISFPSGGVGYQIYHALYQKKPVVIVYTNDKGANPSFIIRGVTSAHAFLIEYKDFDDLKPELLKKIEKAKKLLKVRFNLVINNADFAFLETESKKRDISKTAYLNRLIKRARSEREKSE